VLRREVGAQRGWPAQESKHPLPKTLVKLISKPIFRERQKARSRAPWKSMAYLSTRGFRARGSNRAAGRFWSTGTFSNYEKTNTQKKGHFYKGGRGKPSQRQEAFLMPYRDLRRGHKEDDVHERSGRSSRIPQRAPAGCSRSLLHRKEKWNKDDYFRKP